MSADLDDRIRQAAGDPLHGLDIQQVRARAHQLRRRRMGAVAVASAGFVAIGFLAVPALTSGGPGPTIAPDPAASMPEQPRSAEPQTDSSEGATVDENLASWRRAGAGESLTLPTDAWAQPSFEPLTPDRAGDWSSAADDMVAAATQPDPNGDGLPHVLASPHLGPDGRFVVIPWSESETDRVLIVDEEGAQHIAPLPMTGRTGAIWAPAGYWFLLTLSDDTVTVQRLDDDGRVRSSEPVAEYRPEWGAVLHVHQDEIWVSAGFDADPTRGPHAARLAAGGGDTVVDALEWVPIDQSPITDPGDLAGNGDGSYSVPVEGGAVAVKLQHHDGVDVDLTVLTHGEDPPVAYRGERIATTAAGQVPQVHATVLISAEDSLWATGFPDIATPTGVAIDPTGTPWFIRITPEGYALTELVPPTGTQ